MEPGRIPVTTLSRFSDRRNGYFRHIPVIVLALLMTVIPVSAAITADGSTQALVLSNTTTKIGIYVVDFNRVDVSAGTVGVDFYLSLTSDSPVSINDFELMNGAISSITLTNETPGQKEYRIVAVLTTEPDLSRYPFDRQTLTIKFEPRQKNEQEMGLIIDPDNSGFNPEADLPGWSFTGTQSYVTNMSYMPGEVPYSRTVFNYGIRRDAASTVLKFFLPILLIIIVSLSSLLMRVSSRLGLNASMFLAAVLIHWRIADAIPLVAYVTFLDLFMIVTYMTLVMVLISGVLVLKYTESGESDRVNQINFWSLRLIPVVSAILFLVLFLTLLL